MIRIVLRVLWKFVKIPLVVTVVVGVAFALMTAGGMNVQNAADGNIPGLSQSGSSGDGEGVVTTESADGIEPTETDTPTESPTPETGSASPSDSPQQDAEAMQPVHRDDSSVPAYPPRISKSWDREYWPNEDDPRHTTVTTSEGTEVNTEDIERYVINYTNRYRRNHSLDAWEYSRVLASTSRAHSYDMAVDDYLSHSNPEGERSWDRFDPDGCSTSYGENIAKTWLDRVTYGPYGNRTTYHTEQELGRAIVQYWKESPQHNRLLLMNGFDAAGVGIYLEETERGWIAYATLNVCTFDENEGPDGSKAS